MSQNVAVELGNPFPGLRPFRDDEEHLFFGRESQVDSIVDKLAAARFLAVVGASGSGKSSLVNCGLRPALHRGLMSSAGTSWRIAQFRPGTRPLAALAHALAADGALYSDYSGAIPLAEIIDTSLRVSKRGLIDACRKARPAGGSESPCSRRSVRRVVSIPDAGDFPRRPDKSAARRASLSSIFYWRRSASWICRSTSC